MKDKKLEEKESFSLVLPLPRAESRINLILSSGSSPHSTQKIFGRRPVPVLAHRSSSYFPSNRSTACKYYSITWNKQDIT